MTIKSIFAVCLLAAMSMAATSAEAQLNSRPFSFGSVVNGPIAGSGSAGMSMAGRQAIINEELTGARPRAILVDPSGNILSIERGPGNIAIARETPNSVIPQYRGSGLGFGFSGSSPAYSGRAYTIGGNYNPSIDIWVSMVGGGFSGMQPVSSTSATIDTWSSWVFAY
jgi:hypothetical protein